MEKNTKIAIAVIVGGLILFGAIGGGIVYLVFRLTAPITDSADTFLGLIAQHKYQDAYDSTADGFKQHTTEPQFEAVVTQERLDQYTKSSWSSRSIENGQGTLMGTLTLTGGGTIPVEVDLMEQQGMWKVYGLTANGGGMQERQPDVSSSDSSDAPSDYVAPSDDESMQMAQEVLTLFAQSVKDKDFTSFYDASSQRWQSQTTVAELDKAYISFIVSTLDFSGLETQPVKLTAAPTVKTQDQLVIDGTVADVPKKGETFAFEATFIPEDEEWQLLGLDVSVKNN